MSILDDMAVRLAAQRRETAEFDQALDAVRAKVRSDSEPWPLSKLETMLSDETGLSSMKIRQAVWTLVSERELRFAPEMEDERYVTIRHI